MQKLLGKNIKAEMWLKNSGTGEKPTTVPKQSLFFFQKN